MFDHSINRSTKVARLLMAAVPFCPRPHPPPPSPPPPPPTFPP